MTTQKFKAGDWVKRFERVTKVTDDNGVFYYLQGLGWVTEESIEPMPTPELIAHLEAKSSELNEQVSALINERNDVDRELFKLKGGSYD